MRTFRCDVCGKVEKTLGHAVRHECKGKWRDLREVTKEDEE